MTAIYQVILLISIFHYDLKKAYLCKNTILCDIILTFMMYESFSFDVCKVKIGFKKNDGNH